MTEGIIKIDKEKKSIFLDKVLEMAPDGNLHLCLTCGACSAGCPATGLENMDPRKFLRMAAMGLDDEITGRPLGLDVHHVLSLHVRLPYENQHCSSHFRGPKTVAEGNAAKGHSGVLRYGAPEYKWQRHGYHGRGFPVCG